MNRSEDAKYFATNVPVHPQYLNSALVYPSQLINTGNTSIKDSKKTMRNYNINLFSDQFSLLIHHVNGQTCGGKHNCTSNIFGSPRLMPLNHGTSQGAPA